MDHLPGSVPEALVDRLHDEFFEMPGLKLTLPQAQRLFGLAASECTAALETLVARGVLVMLPGGAYARPVAEAASRHGKAASRLARSA